MPGELRGTATDFCSAILEGSVRISGGAGTEIASAYIIINEWVADLRRFAPASLRDPVEGLTTGLIEISKDLQLGNIATNESFQAATIAALTTADGQAVGSYSKANCPQP